MKCYLLIVLFLSTSLADDSNRNAVIIRQEVDISPYGVHNYLYETGNGIYEDQQGYTKAEKLHATQGQIQYTAPEGNLIRLSYVADENGYQPQGDHLPTPPPIPSAIQRALEYLEKVVLQKNNSL